VSIPKPSTNQRQWEHKAHTTHDKDKHNTTQKTKEMNNLNPTTNQRQRKIRHTHHTTKKNTTKQRKLKG
jgi:hypothetical protein